MRFLMTIAGFVIAIFLVGATSDLVVGNNITLRGETNGHAEMFVNDNTNATSITVQNQWEEINDDLAAGDLNSFTFATSDLTVGVNGAGHSLIIWTASGSGSTGKTYEFAVSVDDAIQSDCQAERKMGSNDVGAVCGTCILDLAVGEVLKLEVRGIDGTVANFTFRDINFSAHRI